MTEPHDLLADIRSLELSVARELEEARAAAADEITRAREEARRLVEEASARGARRAEQRHEERLAAASNEAARIRRAGDDAAVELLEQLRPRLAELGDELVAVVLTTSDGGR